MPRYKITKSLIESWYYVQDCWEGCEEDAYNSFLHVLRCEPEELSEEQQKNIQNGLDQLMEEWTSVATMTDALAETTEAYDEVFRTKGEQQKALRLIADMRKED